MSLTGELPRVSGRHRNRALAKARAVHAVELAAAGKTYASIADVLGYADRGTVHRIVRKELDAGQQRASTSCAPSRLPGSTRCSAAVGRGHRRRSGVVRRRGADHRPAGAPVGGRGCVPGRGRGERAGGCRPEDRCPGASRARRPDGRRVARTSGSAALDRPRGPPGWRSLVVVLGCLDSGVCVWALFDFILGEGLPTSSAQTTRWYCIPTSTVYRTPQRQPRVARSRCWPRRVARYQRPSSCRTSTAMVGIGSTSLTAARPSAGRIQAPGAGRMAGCGQTPVLHRVGQGNPPSWPREDGRSRLCTARRAAATLAPPSPDTPAGASRDGGDP